MKKLSLSQWIRVLHLSSKKAGWWDDISDLTPGIKLLLIHSEISEVDEGLGVGSEGPMDDHLPEFYAWRVELADVFIRVADLLGYLGSHESPSGAEREILEYSMGGVVRQMHKLVSRATEAHRKSNLRIMTTSLHQLMWLTMQWAQRREFSLIQLVEAKMKYNSERADHKPENRAKSGGKKF